MTMFHLKYPASQAFFTWDEMGCLCRALGFPATMIQIHQQSHADEIPYNEKGITLKDIHRMFELNLLYKGLHRTFNMHTADWNCCVIGKALHLLSHKAISFEELHGVRVAYLTYEHIDMKGMPLVKHTLLRTLKMCGRTIAPMKLMHRLKHMKGQFEEKGRIQLYEFFDLILWCDAYTAFKPETVETASGKEEELFKLVDFKQLLSHHDQRMAQVLDQVYLKEEWDFGMESLGPKTLFKEPVVHTDARIAQGELEFKEYQIQDESNFAQRFLRERQQEAHFQKKNYQGLKHEVTHAQKRVYRAHAGSIRPRPISAPDVDKYRRTEEVSTHGRSTAQEAYETVQKRLHSAPSRSSTARSVDRPLLPENVRVHTPSVITDTDMRDVQLKIENLDFDINTLGVRCQLQVEKEMEFYIPDYPDKLANRKTEVEPVPEPERKKIHWTSKIINNLAYPASNLKPAHARTCDARFRGWGKNNKKQGYHTVVTSNSYENSDKGRMFARMEQTAMEPVQYLHPDYVVRYTPKINTHQKPESHKTKIQKSDGDLKSILSQRMDDKNETDDNMEERQQPKVDMDFLHAKYLKDGEIDPKGAKNMSDTNNKNLAANESQRTYPRGLSGKEEDKAKNVQTQGEYPVKVKGKSQVQTKTGLGSDMPEDPPVPHMEHSKPKIVGVGQIGKISLLESIQESRDLEEKLDEETSSPTRSSEPPLCTIDLPTDDDWTEPENSPEDEDVDDAEKLNKIMQLRLCDQTNNKPPSRGRGKTGQSRKSKSAPTLRGKKFSPRKESPRIITEGGKFSEKRSSSAGDAKAMVRSRRGDRKVNSNPKEGQSRVKSACSQSSGPRQLTFSTLRGSLTSDESENIANNTKNDDDSVFSEEMTIASSVGLTELASPHFRRSECLPSLPDINVDLEESQNSSCLKDWRPGHRVQFDMMHELRKTESSKEQHPDLRHAVQSPLSDRERLDNSFNKYDYKIHLNLSDSDIRRPKFSKEIRTRLVGRVEHAISPNLKLRLMGDSMPIPAN